MSSQIQPHDIVGATHWLELKAGTRPALARLNRFEGTTQVYCLRKDFLELTGKTRSGPGKGADDIPGDVFSR